MPISTIIERLKSHANPIAAEGMKRFGVNVETALGVSIPTLRKIAKDHKKDYTLALELWKSGIHEARILASMIDDPALVTEKQMEQWVKDFNSWDVCDQTCGNLFDRTGFAFDKAMEWCKKDKEYIKRAGFVMMAELAVHDKQASNKQFIQFFPYLIEGSTDERNFVKKAVNWAIRQIGKRNEVLRLKCIALSRKIQKTESKAARWIAANAIQELEHEKVAKRVAAK